MKIECAFEVVPVRWGGLDFVKTGFVDNRLTKIPKKNRKPID